MKSVKCVRHKIPVLVDYYDTPHEQSHEKHSRHTNSHDNNEMKFSAGLIDLAKGNTFLSDYSDTQLYDILRENSNNIALREKFLLELPSRKINGDDVRKFLIKLIGENRNIIKKDT